MRIIVMAHGQASRFPGKHFRSVDGTPIIQRLVNQLNFHVEATTTSITIVAPDTSPWRGLGLPIHTYETPPTEPTICHGLDATRNLWGDDHVVYLLGDVVFSEEALKLALAPLTSEQPTFVGRTGPNQFTGCTWGEIFALVMKGEAKETVRRALIHDGIRGRLWDLCRHLGESKDRIAKSAWREVDDWTDDVDYFKDLDALNRLREIQISKPEIGIGAINGPREIR